MVIRPPQRLLMMLVMLMMLMKWKRGPVPLRVRSMTLSKPEEEEEEGDEEVEREEQAAFLLRDGGRWRLKPAISWLALVGAWLWGGWEKWV